MKLNDIFKDLSFIEFSVPLSIPELGIIFLNDNDVFNITINWKHSKCIDQTITVEQLLHLFETNVSCRPGKEEACQKKCEQMIAILKQLDPATIIEL